MTDALLLRSVPFGEADLVVTLFTEARGAVAAIARAARRSSRRFASLEPTHLLRVTVEERQGAELGTLVDSEIVRPRLQISTTLARLDAAGRALRWLRRAAPSHTPEPAAWRAINRLLDTLDEAEPRAAPDALLAAAGLRLLSANGWALDLERCVSCGRACAASSSAGVDATRGGLVCRACGGARTILRPEMRARMVAAAAGDDDALDEPSVRLALELVEEALAAHA